MIAACPSCSARYRIEPERLRPGGVRVRCSRCESVFRVRPPPVVQAVDLAASGATAQPEEASEDSSNADRSRMVLIADSQVEAGKATAHAVAGWGLTPILVHDGVEAIMGIQRMLPSVVVMDAALPKMFGFQVCEVLKRNESLRHIHVVLVGAIQNRDRYRQPSTELYGADCYIERHELSERLWSVLDGIGMPVGEVSGGAPSPVPSIRKPQSVAEPNAPVVPEPGAAPLASASPMQRAENVSPPETPPAMVDPKVADAERLARIVVSDVILYNQEKFDTGVRDGNVLEAMASDLAEGRSLFDSRVEASVRGQRDFLAERLVEVARQRGMP